MDNFIDEAAIHFTINAFAIGLFQIIVIISSVVIITKYPKSIGAKIIFLGTILTLLSLLSFRFLPLLIKENETFDYLMLQVINTYLNTLAFFTFMLGFLIFAVKDLKNDQTAI